MEAIILIAVVCALALFIVVNFFMTMYDFHNKVPEGETEKLYKIIFDEMPKNKPSIIANEFLMCLFGTLIVAFIVLSIFILRSGALTVSVGSLAITIILLFLSEKHFTYIMGLYIISSMKRAERRAAHCTFSKDSL